MASDSTILGAVGEHYVMCQLLRRGMIAALQRRTDMKDGRGRVGLEIIVHDVYTGRVRDAHALSG